eukprot:m.7024 g.7024  ORF g.7024 m.7024 type:complete len:369 (+) comp3631_c0_seq1:183-1289(+)
MFIAVHVGCGYHSESSKAVLKELAAKSCVRGMDVMRGAMDKDSQQIPQAVQAVEAALSILEDSPVTNAGTGSNLNRNGEVECDAGIMYTSPGGVTGKQQERTSVFGSVGAMKGIKNPIKVAVKLASEAQKEETGEGLVCPCMLAGSGATEYALKHGIESSENLVTESSRKRLRLTEESIQGALDSQARRDTVGVICLDGSGTVAAGSSSGGLLLKVPGRVGQAAIFGAGSVTCINDKYSIAATTTGVGEELIKTQLVTKGVQSLAAQECPIEALENTFKNEYMLSSNLGRGARREAGLLAMRAMTDPCDNVTRIELVQIHSTHSMGMGYLSSATNDKTKVRFAENPNVGASENVSKNMTLDSVFIRIE